MKTHLRVLLMHALVSGALCSHALAYSPDAATALHLMKQQDNISIRQLFRQTEIKFGVSIA